MWVGMKIVRLRTSSFFKRFLFSPSSEYWSNRRNAEWLDVSIVKRKGKAFETSSSLISARDAFLFPPTFCYNLNGTGVEIPASIVGMKLLVFSFKQYGFQLGKTYLTHFNDRFSCTQGVCSFELCFVEHKFLSFTKGLLISGLKSSTNANRYDKTAFAFGGTKEFAEALQVPNMLTGYAVLLDRDGRVRWKASGEALDEDLDSLTRCSIALAHELKIELNRNQKI